MKYKEIVKIIKNISFALPDVQSFYIGDVYEVNADQSVKYSSIVLTNQEHTFDNINDRFRYNFILFYIDRLTDDEANRVDVHTAAVSALKTIVQRLEDYNVIINDFKFNLFRERFNDSCAGAYATLSVEVEDNDCNEEFDFGQISPDKLKEISITTNGVYTPDDGYYYTKVSVNVQPSLQTKSIDINENGTYSVEKSDNVDGMSAVEINVNVPERQFTTEELSVTANGTYTPTTDGYSKVTVNVEPNLQAKSIEINENGTSTIVADSNYDGLEAINLNVNVSATASKIIVPDGLKFGSSTVFNKDLFDVSRVTDMSYMFASPYVNPQPATLDLSGWDCVSATTMQGMFYMSKYTDINLTDIIASAVTEMSEMFYACDFLTSISLSGLDLTNVTSMYEMFYNCDLLASINLSGLDLTNVKDMGGMFYASTKLTDLNMNGTILPKINLGDWGLEYSTALTVDSLVSVLNALQQLDDGKSYTCTIGSRNLGKLSDDQKAIATNKNWVLN